MRNLRENTRAVAGLAVGANGATVGKILQGLYGLLNDIMGAPCLTGSNKTNATGIAACERVR